MIFAAFAAALTLSSCTKEESKIDVSGETCTVNFTTSSYTTKTVFGEKNANKYPVLWQDGDKVCPSLNYSDPVGADFISVTPVNGGTGASFSGTFCHSANLSVFLREPCRCFQDTQRS